MSTNHSPAIEMAQNGPVVAGPGAKRDILNLVGLAKPPKLSQSQRRTLEKAKNFAMLQSVESLEKKRAIALQLSHQRTLQRSQAVLLMCRIYVGNISFDVTEDPIRKSFSSFGPIKTINMSWDAALHKHKGFAFIEYEIPEAAQLALEQMNGAVIGGRNIQVGRPTNIPQAQPIIDEIMREAGNYNRIYITSVHHGVGEDDIKTVFGAFGTIKTCFLAQNGVLGRHKGYGFIEYATPQAAQDAICSMNLFNLVGQNLFVGKAILPPVACAVPGAAAAAAAVAAAAACALIGEKKICISPPKLVIPKLGALPSESVSVASVVKKLEVELPQTLEQQEDLVIKGKSARNMVMHKLRRSAESRVIVLKNMVGVEDLDENLSREVTEECARYGSVSGVIIYQERESEDDGAGVCVKIFVEFARSSEAEKAIVGLDKRYFGGRIIKAQVYDQHMFDVNYLSG